MKFVVDSTVFAKTIKKHVKIAKPNKDKPILSNIKLEVSTNKIKVISYDGVTSYITFLTDVKIEEPGEILVNANNLNKILSQYPNKTKLTMLTKNNKLNLKCTGINNRISYEDKAHEYPEVEINKPDVTIDIDSDILIDSFRKVINYADDKPEKILFECVTLSIKNGSILQTYVTTLSKYAQVEYEIDPIGDDYVFTIYSKDIDKILTLLKETSDSITIGLTDKDIIFKVNGDYMTLRKIDVTPIPFDSLLSRIDFSTEIKVRVDDLLQSVNRALAIFSENNKICLSIRKNNIKITGQDKTGNKINETVPSEMITGSDLKIYLNPIFLQFMLRGFEDEYMNMLLQSKITPILFKNEEENEKYILCPVNPENDVEDEEDEEDVEETKEINEETKEEVEEETENTNEEIEEEVEEEAKEYTDEEVKDNKDINNEVNEEIKDKPTYKPINNESTEYVDLNSDNEPQDESKYKEINYDDFDEYEYAPSDYSNNEDAIVNISDIADFEDNF